MPAYFYGHQKVRRGYDIDLLEIFQVEEMFVAGNDKVGLAGNGALQDSIIGVINDNCQALLRVYLF